MADQTDAAAANVGRRLKQLTRMYAALSATNEAIMRIASPKELYQKICETALTEGSLIGAAILLREPGTEWLRVAAGAGRGIERLQAAQISVAEDSPHGQGLASTAFRSGRPCLSNDFLNDVRSAPWRDNAREAGVLAAAALPLIADGTSIGVLVVNLAEVGALDAEVSALVIRMAENVSFALDNLRREQERKANERAASRLQRMYAVLSATNEAILRSESTRELYRRVCDAANLGGRSITAAILIAEPGSSWLRPVAGSNEIIERLENSLFSTDPASPYGNGVCGQAFRDRKLAVNSDILNSEQARPWREAGMVVETVACAAVPLIDRDRSVGVMMFFIGRSWVSDEGILALLARIGENVSFALENLRRDDERRRAEARSYYLATHDDLTGLPNRVMFRQILDQSIDEACCGGRQLSVLFVDLDRFKIINDTLGHAAGDFLLKEITARLKTCVRPGDVVARLGGDEFVALVRDVDDPRTAAVIARSILNEVARPLVIHGHDCQITASVGISTYPTDAEDLEMLIGNADAAMYLAKEDGRSSFRFYSRQNKTQSIERLTLEGSLRRALDRGEFSLLYQAKQDLRTGDVSGVEALLRWRHPELGEVPPQQFIPLAEDTGLIVPIGWWVLHTACAQAMAWQRQGIAPMTMAVNLSPRQFSDISLLSDIEAALDNSGMPPGLLELEITEGMVMRNVERALRVLQTLKSKGVRLAMDDFGTGYSSMSVIKQFPIDTIKLDRSFVSGIAEDQSDRAITRAVIALGKALQLTTVAEGVETQEQVMFLRQQGCDEFQGYLFSTPIGADQFLDFVRTHGLAQLKSRAAAAPRPARRSAPSAAQRAWTSRQR
jgi:diguanylate cyclase (GGDEF)-like protein